MGRKIQNEKKKNKISWKEPFSEPVCALFRRNFGVGRGGANGFVEFRFGELGQGRGFLFVEVMDGFQILGIHYSVFAFGSHLQIFFPHLILIIICSS